MSYHLNYHIPFLVLVVATALLSQVAVRDVTPESVLEDYLDGALEEHKCLSFWAEYAERAGGCRVKMALVEVAKRSAFSTLLLCSPHICSLPLSLPSLTFTLHLHPSPFTLDHP